LERSHDELRISETKFRNFSKTAPVALTRFNLKENKYDFINDEFTRQSGYSLEEFEKLSPEELDKMLYVDDRQRVYDVFKKWEGEDYKGVKRIDYRIKNKERRVLWLDTYMYADFNESGEPISINQICVDVTEQKSVEQSLIRSEERYRAFIAQSTEGIYRLEFEEPINTKLPENEIISLIYKHGYIAECNDVFAKMYGYKNSTSIKGIKLAEIHGGDNNSENVDATKEFINLGYRVNNTETHEIDKEGNSIYVINNSFGMIEKGMLLRIWGTQNDITKQKEILEQNRKLSRAVEQSSASIIITDSKGVIEYVNRKFCDTTLYNFDEVIGK
jgi:PAS domain S-box-containing protein